MPGSPTKILQNLHHRGAERPGIFFDYSPLIQQELQPLDGLRWSRTHGAWWLALNRELFHNLVRALQGQAVVDYTGLKQYLQQRNQPKPLEEDVFVSSSPALPQPPLVTYKKLMITAGINAHVLADMEEQLKLKAYSKSTIRTYLNEMAQLLQMLGEVPATQLEPQHLRRYLLYCYEKLGLSENTLHSRINALKFYYEQVLQREKFFWEIPRPKKLQQLPKVLEKEEIILLIKAISNIKHRTMIMLAYGCGLRVSEVVALKITDIDGNRRILYIRRGKGKKDRVVTLSPALLVVLRDYYKAYKPQTFLFEGQAKGEQYSARSLQAIVSKAKAKAGIKKIGSMHMLRHSFATHLLDRGTDVVLIQKLLGHNDIKTTLRYLHVTNRDLMHIISPLDDIKDFL